MTNLDTLIARQRAECREVRRMYREGRTGYGHWKQFVSTLLLLRWLKKQPA